MDAYVTKPVHNKALFDAIAAVVPGTDGACDHELANAAGIAGYSQNGDH
jgi:hypothetical protein